MILIKRNDVFQIFDSGREIRPTPRWVYLAIINGALELFTAKLDEFKLNGQVGHMYDFIVNLPDGMIIVPEKEFLNTYKIED